MSEQTIDPTRQADEPEAAPRVKPKPHSGDFEREIRTVNVGTVAQPRNVRVRSGLTRKGMEDVIRSGQSVMHDGQIYSSIENLPTADDLAIATGDQSQVDSLLKQKEEEINRLKAERDDLKKKAASNEAANTAPKK
jgi:hypothetical protein